MTTPNLPPLPAPSTPAGEPTEAWLQRACDAIEEALMGHRLSEWHEEGDETSNFPLVDHLSHGNSIESGKREIEMILETVYFALKSAVTQPAGEAEALRLASPPIDALIIELKACVDLDGFGCACLPEYRCQTCRTRDVMAKLVQPAIRKYEAAVSPLAAAPEATKGNCPFEACPYVMTCPRGECKAAEQ